MKRLVAAVLLVVALGGCAGALRGMRALPSGQQVTTTPPAGKAAVVFLRPSVVGYTASLFALRKDEDVFIGHMLSYKKLLYLTEPGPVRFMILGEGAANFMNAELEAGKTYYALVTSQSGSSRIRFSFRPVTKADAKDLSGWLQDCAWIENSPEARAWATAHWDSIQTRKARYLGTWETQSDKPVLRASDGW